MAVITLHDVLGVPDTSVTVAQPVFTQQTRTAAKQLLYVLLAFTTQLALIAIATLSALYVNFTQTLHKRWRRPQVNRVTEGMCGIGSVECGSS